jgi:hypothetical protein
MQAVARSLALSLFILAIGGMGWGAAFAASYGMDTPVGVGDMPFGLQGTEVMDLSGGGLTINQNTGNAVTINQNQIWRSATGGDSTLYLQYSTPGGEVLIGGQPGQSNTLDVQGYVHIRSVNGEGGIIQLDGNNGTTMWVENLNGVFRLVNSPWSAQIFSVDQSGNVVANGEVSGNLANGLSQVRMIGGAYGAMWRNDGANLYLLFTAANNQTGEWNALRPITFDDTDNNVSFGGRIGTMGYSPNDLPNGWSGGVRTYDVYASGTIGMGPGGGGLTSYFNNDQAVFGTPVYFKTLQGCPAGSPVMSDGSGGITCGSNQTTSFYVIPANGGYGVVNPFTGGYSCPSGTVDRSILILWYGSFGFTSMHSCTNS